MAAKPSVREALAKKAHQQQQEPAAPPPADRLAKKVDDSKITTSLRIERDTLGELKVLALQKGARVNELIVEAIKNYLAINGRHAA
jgi:hypothetical protein